MCSLPFFLYGIARGDEVSTDENLTIDGMAQRSGQRLLRVLSSEVRASTSTKSSSHFSDKLFAATDTTHSSQST
jgi:hypothetical protein